MNQPCTSSRTRKPCAGRLSMIEPLEARVAPATLTFAQQLASGYQTSVPVATDSAGNVYVTGVFDGVIDMDPSPLTTAILQTQESNPNGPTGSDLFIAKYAPDGSLLWARSWGGVSGSGLPVAQEIARDLVVDAGGNVFVLAEFDTANAGFGGVGTVSSNSGTLDTVVLKLSGTNGAPVSGFGVNGVLRFGGSGQDHAGRLGLDLGGNLLITGSYDSADAQINGVGTFPGPALANGDETYLLRVAAATGSTTTQFGVNGLIHFGSPAADSGGRPLATGGFLFIEAYEAKNGHVRKLEANFGNPVPGFGVNGRLDIANLGGVALDRQGRLLATGGIESAGGYVKRFDPGTGALDATFAGDGTVDLGTTSQFGQNIVVENSGAIYVGGTRKANPATPGQYFLAKITEAGGLDTSLGANGRVFFGTTGADQHREIRLVVDPNGFVTMRGFFSGTTDLDPSNGTAAASSAIPSVNAGHPSLDAFTIRLDPNGVNAGNPVTFTDASGDVVRIAIAGGGALRVIPGVTPGVDIERIEVVQTDGSSKLKIGLSRGSVGTTTIGSIITPGTAQDLGSLTLGKNIILGDGVPGGDPALKVTGKIGKVTLSDINAYAVIDFGEGLAYLDTYTNRPNFTARDILGEGVVIDVTGDGTAGGIGGGGLGRVTVNRWTGDGLIKTTQSITSYRQKLGDCFVVFEVDKFEVGAMTKADLGSISIPNGAWGSSGTEIEGMCGTFSCVSFLAGASISAANMKTLLVKNGSYAGTTTLRDPSAAGMGTFKVVGDFVGYVDSASSIRNIKVVGDFMGSLLAKSIGAISAAAFDGTTTGDLYGDPLRHEIIATSGSLGLLKTTAGGMKNFEVVVFTTFGGFKISTGSGANASLAGLENVQLLAAQVGNIAISLKAASGAGAITLQGLKDTVIESETTIGTVTSTHAIVDSIIAAGTQMGNVTVGTPGFATQGISGSMLLGGVNLGGDGALDGDETFVRLGKIGNVTVKGALVASTIAAGINPVDGVFGNGNDLAGAGAALPATQKAIGHVVLGAGSGVATGNPLSSHQYAIEGQKIGSLKIGATTVPLAGLPQFLKIGAVEASSDVLVQII